MKNFKEIETFVVTTADDNLMKVVAKELEKKDPEDAAERISGNCTNRCDKTCKV